MKFFAGVGRGPWTSRLDFGSDPLHYPNPVFLDLDHNPDPGTLKDSLFTIAKQPRLKHDNPRRRFALYRVLSCFLIFFLLVSLVIFSFNG